MRRTLALLLVVTLSALAAPTMAPAAPGAVTVTRAGYFTPGDDRPYTHYVGSNAIETVVLPLIIEAGDDLVHSNVDQEGHNLASVARTPNGKFLFGGETTSVKQGEAIVIATSHLPPGQYAFLCTIHPFMTGTLTVR